jgi:hypothetical protein
MANQFLLPSVRENHRLTLGKKVGAWSTQDVTDPYTTLADALEFARTQQVVSVNSIPTMWARPLLFDSVLHGASDHPLYKNTVSQWRGMLAAIALAEYFERAGHKLSASIIDLTESEQSFIRTARRDVPTSSDRWLYRDGQLNSWYRFYIFYWNNQPVGMTSPSTILFPATEGNWEGLPWFKDGYLSSPIEFLIKNEPKLAELLAKWLQGLSTSIQDEKYGGNKVAINKIQDALNTFMADLGFSNKSNSLQDLKDEYRANKPDYLGVKLDIAFFGRLLPIKLPEVTPDILIKGLRNPSKEILFYDSTLPQVLDKRPDQIIVKGKYTLANWNPNISVNALKCITSDDIFLDDIYHAFGSGIFTNSLMPHGSDRLSYEGDSISILPPLREDIFDLFEPSYLFDRLQVETKVDDDDFIYLSLDLELSGGDFKLVRKYPIKEENRIANVPIVELWPNFVVENWNTYYLYNLALWDDSFSVKVINQIDYHGYDTKNAHGESVGKSNLWQLNKPPEFVCCVQNQTHIGVLALQPKSLNVIATSKEANVSLEVALDFGTSFTIGYVKREDEQPKIIDLKPLNLPLTSLFQRDIFCRLEFIPTREREGKPVDELQFPLMSIFEANNSRKIGGEDLKPLFNGRLASYSEAGEINETIKCDLKWGDDPQNRQLVKLFLLNVSLQITASLVSQHQASTYQWAISYPSAFTDNDKSNYLGEWQSIVEKLVEMTGFEHKCPTESDKKYFRSESSAVGQYFADDPDIKRYHSAKINNSCCIDIGGGTSDICIWTPSSGQVKNIHKSSVQLAGKHLFSDLLTLKPELLYDIGFFKRGDLDNLSEKIVRTRIDFALRYNSDAFFKKNAVHLQNNQDFNRLRQIMSLGFAGLYYYVGIILSSLKQSDKYNQRDASHVFLGGNGSRLSKWLSYGKEFPDGKTSVDVLLNFMVILSSSLPPLKKEKKDTILSNMPKGEVSAGLLHYKKRMETPVALKAGGFDAIMDGENPDEDESNFPIAGEKCRVNGQEFDWYDVMNISDPITDYNPPMNPSELYHLPQFLWYFHEISRKGQITKLNDIDVVRDYTHRKIDLNFGDLQPIINLESGKNKNLWEDNSELWWEVIEELQDSLMDTHDSSGNKRLEPPFILGLRSLIRVLGKRWARP